MAILSSSEVIATIDFETKKPKISEIHTSQTVRTSSLRSMAAMVVLLRFSIVLYKGEEGKEYIDGVLVV